MYWAALFASNGRDRGPALTRKLLISCVVDREVVEVEQEVHRLDDEAAERVDRVARSLSVVSGPSIVRSCWYDSATSSASARSALLERFWVQFNVARWFRVRNPCRIGDRERSRWFRYRIGELQDRSGPGFRLRSDAEREPGAGAVGVVQLARRLYRACLAVAGSRTPLQSSP